MYKRLKSFFYALRGIGYALKQEPNFRAECIIAVIVVVFMFVLPLSVNERVFLVVAIFLVLVMELINTALERTMDILKPRVHPYVQTVKDVMAGAVLITTIGAAAIGLFVFGPFVLALLP
jgi:diacylglycerol kinase